VRIVTPPVRLRILEEEVGIPEPSTLALMGTGLLALAGWAWGRRRKPKR
jgi:hypothetical protein